VAFWILYIVSSVSLGAFEKITPYVPFNFAYSVALSPSVGMYYVLVNSLNSYMYLRNLKMFNLRPDQIASAEFHNYSQTWH
jgi:hypothetical protein